MKRIPDARAFIALLVALVVLLVSAILNQTDMSRVVNSQTWVTHSLEVKSTLQTLLTVLARAESAGRGYVLTKRLEFVDDFTQDKGRVAEILAELKRTTSDSHTQQSNLEELSHWVNLRITQFETGIERRRTTPDSLWKIDPSRVNTGRRTEDELSRITGAISQEEDQLLSQRQAEAALSEQRARITFFVTTGLSAIGVTVAFILLVRIVREREANEENIREINAGLESRIAERTAALEETNGRLEATNGRLEEANKELEAFSYSVSHDLRAPLRHIAGFATLLQSKASERLDETGQRYVQNIVGSARYAGQLVDDLLAFSRMGRAEMRRSPVTMATQVKQVQNDLAPEIGERKITWNIGDLPTVQGDPEMLRLVWQNLVANAVKYTRGREPAIIEIGYERNDNEHIFVVRDNGAGFDMTYVHRLFGVFQRLHTKEEFEGTGIGLANVRRIIHRHGGRTWAEGKVNEGASFYFTLPIASEGTAPNEKTEMTDGNRKINGVKTNSAG